MDLFVCVKCCISAQQQQEESHSHLKLSKRMISPSKMQGTAVFFSIFRIAALSTL